VSQTLPGLTVTDVERGLGSGHEHGDLVGALPLSASPVDRTNPITQQLLLGQMPQFSPGPLDVASADAMVGDIVQFPRVLRPRSPPTSAASTTIMSPTSAPVSPTTTTVVAAVTSLLSYCRQLLKRKLARQVRLLLLRRHLPWSVIPKQSFTAARFPPTHPKTQQLL
jgi:hypothetical protein